MSRSNMMPNLFRGEELTIVSDSEEFLGVCSKLGCKTAVLSQVLTLPPSCVVFSFTDNAAKSTFDIAKDTVNKQTIFCALQVFDPSLNCALYTLNLLFKSDFAMALRAQRSVLNMLNSNTSFLLSGSGEDAQVCILPHAQPYALIDEDIAGDFVQSVAEFFEVHYAHMNPRDPCPFSFSGVLKVFGILTVLRRRRSLIVDSLENSLQQLRKCVSEEGALLTVDDNRITSFKTTKAEHVGLLELAAGSRGLMLTEFAIGVNAAIGPHIDYGINSQMNEGVSGVHVAVGDGSSGYHIDFLCPDVRVVPR